MRIKIEFTNFAAAILLFAGFAVAAINVNPGNNAEIVDFIESESKKILQVPDSLVLNLTFQTAKDEHSRAGFLFFVGQRRITIKADYSMDKLHGSLQADTAWFTGYCGMIECQNEPMPAHQRIEVAKYLVSKILKKLNGKIKGAFVKKSAAPASQESQEAIKIEEEEEL